MYKACNRGMYRLHLPFFHSFLRAPLMSCLFGLSLIAGSCSLALEPPERIRLIPERFLEAWALLRNIIVPYPNAERFPAGSAAAGRRYSPSRGPRRPAAVFGASDRSDQRVHTRVCVIWRASSSRRSLSRQAFLRPVPPRRQCAAPTCCTRAQKSTTAAAPPVPWAFGLAETPSRSPPSPAAFGTPSKCAWTPRNCGQAAGAMHRLQAPHARFCARRGRGAAVLHVLLHICTCCRMQLLPCTAVLLQSEGAWQDI